LYTLNYLSAAVVSSGPKPLVLAVRDGKLFDYRNDGWGCSATSAAVVVTEPDEVKADLVLSRSKTCLTLSQLTLTATGGTGPYNLNDITYLLPFVKFNFF
jgi:hypothetical protein